MNTHIINRIFLLLTPILFWQCERCNEQKEVQLEVWFSGFEVLPQWEKIYVIGSEKQVIPETIVNDQRPLFYLPVNTHSDTSTYIFQSGTTLDTLLITYSRTFDFQSKKCGFTIGFNDADVLKSPKSLKTSISLGVRPAIFTSGPFEAKLTFYP